MIDTSHRDELKEIAEIELAKDEDSVTTLAVASSTEHAITALAGINSSDVEQKAGKNEHLRSFRISLPARKRKADGSLVEESDKPAKAPGVQALSKTALFKSANGPKNETYQRVLRASTIKARNQSRIAAIASGLAPDNEIVTFQPVSNALTSTVDEISRISLGKHEAADVDVIAVEEDGHCLAYCVDDAVFLQKLPRSRGSEIKIPALIYETIESQAFHRPSKSPKFRGMRFITPKHILLLQNRPNREGARLLILKLDDDLSSGHITLRKILSKTTKSAVGLDICRLSSNAAGEFQTIIAVSTQDSAIELLTIDYHPLNGLRRFEPYARLPEVHSGPLTRITFSNFISPTLPTDKNTLPQLVRLASVGVDQTLVVHTLHLRPHPPTSTQPRYTLTVPTDTLQTTFSIVIAIGVITLVALLMQAFCEIRGALPPTLGATNYLSPRISSMIARPYPSLNPSAASASISSLVDAITHAPDSIPTAILPSHPIASLQSQLSSLASEVGDATGLNTPKAIVVRDTGADVAAELAHDLDVVKQETVKKWEQLTEKEKKGWKKRLIESGHWVEEQGEKVLKGVLFSELAGFVGAVAREGL